MEIISDIENNKESIRKIIAKYSNAAEHNYFCYLYNIEQHETPFVFVFENDCAILSKRDNKDNEWYVFTEILAPQTKKSGIIKEFLDYVFDKGTKKVWLELTSETRKELLGSLKGTRFKANKINYTLTWPVYDMKTWDGERMEGKTWKDMRYYWNKFFKEHKVEFKEYTHSDSTALKSLVYRWKKERTGKDRAFIHYYLNAIDNDFEGYDVTRIMIVDGSICAITAGFKVEGKSYYYSSIGIVSKEFERAGEIANMDDLINLKKLGYETVDFGGIEKKGLEFKKKFNPTSYYKTHIFSIVIRK